MKYGLSEEVIALLPSASQVKNRAHRLRRRGDFDITTYADVMVWATPRLCTTPAAFFVSNELIVLYCFTDTIDSGDTSVGIIFTSRGLFRTAPRTVAGQNDEMLGVTDGTYKLHFGGRTLVSFGTFGLRYTALHAYQQKFYPMAFMFVRTN
ncbi:hypothetical protein PHYSODRAFT_497253 [Phytophthora sojae]|uniref:Uncharacterized protein n=1 Tax=Phytophthora sojae (strain P6497) TaxID=1094619 RepID=G4Z817_PHYSP|nr:hypothetical protein PHYSODRAFT_497253 [Phytophthora sojae]EGZ19672.1 hypothetical protein PHYSODRAFT_497253 [Phytophthora sojae]|eukprot:XP_009522389.1 hypothetical protein PHYSODRAFT_497253 [Phytophthora sojae]